LRVPAPVNVPGSRADGGSVDTAGTLRGTCASSSAAILTAIASSPISPHSFADKELSVRVNVARAVEQVGADSAALLLRLRAELASDAPELLGACYSGVLALEGLAAIPWAARFLPPADDAAAEAAMAITQTHTLEAFQLLRTTFAKARESWFRTAVLSAVALTRQQQATDWLLELFANEQRHAADAHEALCRSAPSAATLDRLRQLGKPCIEG
jgi:hypothetical protein